ncbi:MAG TPA: hypothetical protein VMJ74_00840, partial [Pseudomonadales bacterium]|nr:hypothetical protein [Pseudomonadales bacterium]
MGDCDDDGRVEVDELVKGVNIALGTLEFDACPAFDTDNDQHVGVNELVQAVNAALLGCVRRTETPSLTPGLPTITPSPTVSLAVTTPPTSTPTPTPTGGVVTPGDLARSIAGRAALIADGMGAIPSVVTALAAGFVLDSGGSTPGPSPAAQSSDLGGSASAACPLGGSVTRTCTGTGSVVMTISFSSCSVTTPDGFGTFDGTMTLSGSGFCPNLIVPPFQIAIDFSGSFTDSQHDP